MNYLPSLIVNGDYAAFCVASISGSGKLGAFCFCW